MILVENAIALIPLVVVFLILLILCAFWKKSKVVETDHMALQKYFKQRCGERDRRSGVERRSGQDRRNGKERRIFSD
jgi:hypothetical protein